MWNPFAKRYASLADKLLNEAKLPAKKSVSVLDISDETKLNRYLNKAVDYIIKEIKNDSSSEHILIAAYDIGAFRSCALDMSPLIEPINECLKSLGITALNSGEGDYYLRFSKAAVIAAIEKHSQPPPPPNNTTYTSEYR